MLSRHCFRNAIFIKNIVFYPESSAFCSFSTHNANCRRLLPKFQVSTRSNGLLHSPQTLYAVRHASTTPLNTIIMFVPQQEAWVVERMGKFHRILEPGLNFLIPVVDKVKYVQSLKELAIDIPKQSAITLDNVTLNIDGVLYLRVVNPYKASYGVEDPEFAVTQLAQTTMRSELGKITLDSVFRERESLNIAIVDAINKASSAWGIDCLRYEIRDIRLPQRVNEAMQMQVEAERKKRAAVLESEGIREADINVAEGKKRARVLGAEGEASAIFVKANARAKSLRLVASALENQSGGNAASLLIAEQYIEAFGKLAKSGNTLILPANTNDVSGMVAQAMSVYNTLSTKEGQQQQIALADSIEDTLQATEKDWAEYISDREEVPKDFDQPTESKFVDNPVTNTDIDKKQ